MIAFHDFQPGWQSTTVSCARTACDDAYCREYGCRYPEAREQKARIEDKSPFGPGPYNRHERRAMKRMGAR